MDSKNNHLPSAHTSDLAAKALHEPFPTSVSSLSAPHTNLSQTAVTTDHSIAPIIPGLCCLWAGCPRLWPLQVPTVGLFQEPPPLGCSSSSQLLMETLLYWGQVICTQTGSSGGCDLPGPQELHPQNDPLWPGPVGPLGWALPSLPLLSFKPRALPKTSQLLSVPSSQRPGLQDSQQKVL